MSIIKLPIGVSDFKKIILGNYHYIDKSLFIKEVLDRGDTILLLPRPRRFGKTLNLSMLRYFYDCCPETGAEATYSPQTLFGSLAIMEAGEEYTGKMGQHPVIYLSFRNIKESDWETAHRKIIKLIRKEYARHYYLLESKKLLPYEQEYFRNIIDLKGHKEDYENSLENLLIFLNKHHDKRVVILIDEYDAPIHAGFTYHYYEEIIGFMRNFLCGGLKDTDQYLEKSVLTGIMRVAKESIFSGLNNLGVYTLVSDEFNRHFGFTQQEVDALLKDFNLLDRYDDVQQWYNGYRFGTRTIYNPWSIINFLGSKEKELKPYWINTSDNKIVEFLLSKGGKELKDELEQLIRGETIERVIEENIIMKDITLRENLLWSFLLMTGYLKSTAKRLDRDSGKMHYTLAIPNMEVRTIYIGIVENFFSGKLENKNVAIMLKALSEGDIDVFEEIFSDYVMKSMSLFDMGEDPENVYHAFVMGLLLWLAPGYQVKSNRESGYGRYDIMIIPVDVSQLGYIIEFKKVRKKETLDAAIDSALKQIEEQKYETELIERGVKKYKKLAIVFKGKDVTIRES